jgi:AraC-like DNA-binding protein
LAERAGFATRGYFCDVFRNASGKTPAEFRRELVPPLQQPSLKAKKGGWVGTKKKFDG